MPSTSELHTVQEHFRDRAPEVKATYDRIVEAARKLGPVREEAKKTSIHLVRKTAFAGVATRKSALILTLKLDSDVKDSRILKHEQASKRRWHLEVRIERPGEVDSQLRSWLKQAYVLSG